MCILLSTMKNPVYMHPALYRFAMRLLYGKHYEDRYKTLAALIPENSTVIEVCMGDAYLYEHYLKQKNIKYQGLDINKTFIEHATGKNISCKLFDLSKEEIPSADYVIMQGSLYQFMPDEKNIIARLLVASSKCVLIAEPVVNMADSKVLVVSFLAKYFSRTDGGEHPNRFNEKTLSECFSTYREFSESLLIPGGREMIGVFLK